MRFEDAIQLLESTSLQSHPTYAEAFILVKTYAFNYFILTRRQGSSSNQPRNDVAGLIGYKKEVKDEIGI